MLTTNPHLKVILLSLVTGKRRPDWFWSVSCYDLGSCQKKFIRLNPQLHFLQGRGKKWHYLPMILCIVKQLPILLQFLPKCKACQWIF